MPYDIRRRGHQETLQHKSLLCQVSLDVTVYNRNGADLQVSIFLTLGGKLHGYEKNKITLYIHVMVYHMSHWLKG